MLPQKQKSVYSISGIIFLVICLFACEQKQAELKSPQTNIPVKVFNGMQLGSLLNEVIVTNDIENIKAMLKNDWYSAINVKSLKDEKVTYSINSCNEYFKFSNKKIAPVRENEINAYAEFVLMCKAAKDIVEAVPSAMSFLNDLKLNKELPDKLPKQVAVVISTTESARINSDSEIVTWADVNKVTEVELKNQYKAIYSFPGIKQEIELIAQADFDNDDVEDVLISSRDSVENGSYSALRLFLFTKQSEDGMYKIIKEYSY